MTLRIAPPGDARIAPLMIAFALVFSLLSVVGLAAPAAEAGTGYAPPDAPCTDTVSSKSALNSAISSASNGSVICVADGSYGSLTVSARRSGFVTVRSLNPHTAVFSEVFLSNASHVRFEEIRVDGRFGNGQDNSDNIHLAGSVVRSVWAQAPSLAVAGPGPSDWLIEYNDVTDCPDFCVALVSESPDRYWPVSDITVRGNKLGPMAGGEDAIRIHNWRDLVIENNEIFGVIEDGQHNDCLQSVWGGHGIVFSGNYLHDNNCQTFFLKDGYTTDIEVSNNLSLRNREGSAPVVGQIWPSANVVMKNNTFWDDSGFYLRSGTYSSMFTSGPTTNYLVTKNVFEEFLPYDDSQGNDNRAGIFKDSSVLVENKNLFAGGWSWVPTYIGAHSIYDTSPDFRNPTTSRSQDLSVGDYRLDGPVTRGGVTYTPGITWKLSDRSFGVEAYGLEPPPIVDPPPGGGDTPPPGGGSGSTPFTDIAGSVFEADIEAAWRAGITKGCNPPANTAFCPDRSVTRAEMAAFLVRSLGLTEALDDPFTDDDDSVFESDIEKLVAAGITRGCNPKGDGTLFCPNKPVTRGEMAAFLSRALDLPSAKGTGGFVDTAGSIFVADIARLEAAGLTSGCNPPVGDRFCPSSRVTRGQMAAFLNRAGLLD